jgi:hypothetical protein
MSGDDCTEYPLIATSKRAAEGSIDIQLQHFFCSKTHENKQVKSGVHSQYKKSSHLEAVQKTFIFLQ